MIVAKPDIIETIEREGIEFKRKGHDYWIRHHGERTASCKISSERQTYHCFGCGSHGDVIDFIAELHSLSFKTACRYLSIVPGQPVQPDPVIERRRQLFKAFELWRKNYFICLCNQKIHLDKLKLFFRQLPNVSEDLAWSFAETIGQLNIVNYKIDLIGTDNEEILFAIYLEDTNERKLGRKT